MVVRRLIVELSNNMLVKLIANGTMREHGPVNGNELFDDLLREAMVFVILRIRRNRVGDSGWFFHGGFLRFAKAAKAKLNGASL